MEKPVPVVKLYNFFRSSASFRVRIALNLKKIQYEYISINIMKGDQKEESYVKKNPTKLVPCLDIDGVLLNESLPIIEYLDETRPVPSLMPKDPLSRAKVRAICEMINAGMQPLQNPRVLAKVEELKGDQKEWLTYFVTMGTESLEKFLAGTKGKYCFGDNITVADLFFYPQILAAVHRFGIDINKYPIIKGIYDNLSSIPEIIEALPKNQPDFEK